MTDLYLKDLMEGKIFNRTLGQAILSKSTQDEKDRFEIETERVIEDYLDSLNLDSEDPSQDKFTSPSVKRARICLELQEKAKLPELSQFIDSAFKILIFEGKNYLDEQEFESMENNFVDGNEILQGMDLNSAAVDNFQKLLHFTDSTIDSIFKIGLAKFNESHYSDSLSLFILLALLAPENADYWYRAGILAQKNENYELANRLFSTAIALDSLLLGAWIFSIECFLKRDMMAEALIAFEDAKKIYEISESDESWSQMLKIYDDILIKPHV